MQVCMRVIGTHNTMVGWYLSVTKYWSTIDIHIQLIKSGGCPKQQFSLTLLSATYRLNERSEAFHTTHRMRTCGALALRSSSFGYSLAHMAVAAP
eukprot:6191108-Pleurochrysis_carterae.AAC.1